MKVFQKKLDASLTIAVALFAVSIALFNFNNLSWQSNAKSYIGLASFLILIVIYFWERKRVGKNIY